MPDSPALGKRKRKRKRKRADEAPPVSKTKPEKPKKPARRSASAPPAKKSGDLAPLPSMDAEAYARARKIQSVHERMARLGWVLQHRVCQYLESIED